MGQDHPHFDEVFRAARDGDADRVCRMIDEDRTLLDIVDTNVNSPLLVALRKGHLALAERLIELGANVFVMNHSDDWPMGMLTRRNGLRADDRKRFVEVAIKAGVTDAEIFHAVWRRDFRRVREILSTDPGQASIRLADPDGGKGFYNDLPYCGLTPLHYAVLAGDHRTVAALLDAGAEVDAVPHGYEPTANHTPLMFVPSGCRAIARLLIEHGANVMHTAAYLSWGSKALREEVIARGAAGSPLMTALYLKQLDKAVEIARDDPAVIHDRTPGASVDTPLHLAAKVGCTELIDLLIDHGMAVDTPSSGGDSVLTMAAEMYCSFDVFRLLVERGADLHVDNDLPLHNVVWQHAYGHWDYERVIRFLTARGARPRGLHHCARAGNLRATELLVELAADVNDRQDDCWPLDESGHTPLDYCTGVAGRQSYPKLADFLRRHGGVHSADLPDAAP